jgi:ribosome recycling factor
VATLSIPEPRLITIAPWEAKLIPIIEKAIFNANIGLTPSNDGRSIRLSLPPLTEERRKEIVKDIKKKGEDDKVALRNIRRDTLDRLKKLEKDKAITEDELKKLEKEVQDTTKFFEQKVDEAVANKEKEVMEV